MAQALKTFLQGLCQYRKALLPLVKLFNLRTETSDYYLATSAHSVDSNINRQKEPTFPTDMCTERICLLSMGHTWDMMKMNSIFFGSVYGILSVLST